MPSIGGDQLFTTADIMKPREPKKPLWTTVEGTPLVARGNYPGKPHSVLQRIGQLASFGHWNPDDQTGTAVNAKILAKEGGDKSELHNVQEKRTQEVKLRADAIQSWDPNIPRQASERMANEPWVKQLFAESAASDAAKSASDVENERSRGYVGQAREVGAANAGQDLSAAGASTEQNRNLTAAAEAQGRMELLQKRAMLEKLSLEDKIGSLNTQRANDLTYEPLRNRQTLAQLQAAANQAEASSRLLNNPTTADRLAQSQANKQLTSELPPWSTASVPFPALWDSPVRGVERPSSNLGGYTTAEAIQLNDLGQRIGSTKIRTAERPGTPGTAPAAPAAPQLSPMGAGKQTLRLTPEEFQTLLNSK